MIWKIVRHEVKQRVFHWMTLVFYVLLIFQSLWYTQGFFDYYPSEDLLMNAPIVNYRLLSSGGFFLLIMLAITTGPFFYKEIQFKTINWFYTLPINEKQFFLGRFLAAFLYNSFLTFATVVGMFLVPHVGMGEAERFGPAPIGQLLHGFSILVLPNVLLVTSMITAALVFTRKITISYLAVFLLLILFLLMQSITASSGINFLLLMLEPFGFVAVEEINNGMTVLQKNTDYIDLSGNLLANRSMWFGISLFLIIVSYVKFSFKGFFGNSKSKGKEILITDAKNEVAPPIISIKRPQLSFKNGDFVKKLWTLSFLEFKNVVRPASFKIILALIVLMIVIQNLLWNASFYLGPTQPLTFTMTNFRITFGVFVIILIMIWSGELFFKDKIVKIDRIMDTLPVPLWVTQLSRFIAMSGVALILSVSFIAMGVIFQILKGGTGLIEMKLYTYDLLGYNWGWLTFVLEIALVFFLAGLTDNRYLTHFLSVGIVIANIFAFALSLGEQVRFYYAGVPGLEDYSEISGYGIWEVSAIWFFLMWVMLATTFILLGIYFWKRGMDQNRVTKWTFRGNQLSLTGKLAALGALIAFFTLQSFIVKNVNDKDNFTLAAEEEKAQADYEKRFEYIKEIPQPKYAAVDLLFDYYPSQRKASFEAVTTLINDFTSPIDTLYISHRSHVTIEQITRDGKQLVAAWKSDEYDMVAYPLNPTLNPNDSTFMIITASKQYEGFTQDGGTAQPDLTFNGSFGSIKDFLPTLGYHAQNELTENRKRLANGLPRLDSRMASITDEFALSQDLLAPDATKLKGSITIGTEDKQIPLAPGKLVKKWQENGRSYRTYHIDNPQSFNWHLASCDLSEKEGQKGKVKTTILYSPKHPFNLALYETALHSGIEFLQNKLGGYPYDEVRLVEIAFYQESFYAYPNTIAISEKEGWYADTTAISEKAYLFHSVATQVAKQWLYGNLNMSNVQGATMLSEALPHALGLQVLQMKLGQEAVESVLQKKQDFYLMEKNNEPNQEPPLLYADGIEYLEANKGVIALQKGIEVYGRDKFYDLLLQWSEDNRGQSVRFSDFYQELLSAIPEEEKEMIKKLFETTEPLLLTQIGP
ncbi:MAG: hypothetical protein AAF620_12675 [Bacteroidota bacterium]